VSVNPLTSATPSPTPPTAGPQVPLTRPRSWQASLVVTGIVAVAVAVRFVRLGHQSYWLDEAYTVLLMKQSFAHMLSTIPQTERTPPLYFVSAWVWSRVFGFGELGLRSLSAVVGVLTVVAAGGLGRRLFAFRAGVFAATLVAVNPFLIFYSQEARSYSLLVLFSTCALWGFVEAFSRASTRALVAWAVFSALALLTHYFAIFLLIPEAVVLLWRVRDRRVVLACAAWVLVGAALSPLLTNHTA
jgi:mannosyltransferase